MYGPMHKTADILAEFEVGFKILSTVSTPKMTFAEAVNQIQPSLSSERMCAEVCLLFAPSPSVSS